LKRGGPQKKNRRKKNQRNVTWEGGCAEWWNMYREEKAAIHVRNLCCGKKGNSTRGKVRIGMKETLRIPSSWAINIQKKVPQGREETSICEIHKGKQRKRFQKVTQELVRGKGVERRKILSIFPRRVMDAMLRGEVVGKEKRAFLNSASQIWKESKDLTKWVEGRWCSLEEVVRLGKNSP